MERLFSAFPKEWDDQSKESKEYQIVGEVSLKASDPKEAARKFVDAVRTGEIVAMVRNINTDSIFDIYLDDLKDLDDREGEEGEAG